MTKITTLETPLEKIPLTYQAFMNCLAHCPHGEITIETPTGQTLSYKGQNPGPKAHLYIKDWSVIDTLLKRGDIGLGESYAEGHWDSKNVIDFLKFGAMNMAELEKYAYGSMWRRILMYLRHKWFRLNTKRGSKANIHAHYDMGNEFYKLWLDATMTYSSALRLEDNPPLEEAQKAKYHRILDLLPNKPLTILEIGCGWGGFAEAAATLGHHVTGITISEQQLAYAQQRLGPKADIIFEDYRNIKDTYDAIVSIEMFEAVGEKYWPSYFNTLAKSLKKSGKAIIQTITIDDDAFENYRRDTDYIRHYVFPGGMLPSKKRFFEEVRKANLKVASCFEFGQDYAWTLRQWLFNVETVKSKILSLGYTESFFRAWTYYLYLCIAGFEMERTNVMQVELVHA